MAITLPRPDESFQERDFADTFARIDEALALLEAGLPL